PLLKPSMRLSDKPSSSTTMLPPDLYYSTKFDHESFSGYSGTLRTLRNRSLDRKRHISRREALETACNSLLRDCLGYHRCMWDNRATILWLIMGWTVAIERPFDLAKRSWGGFDERPTTAKCYRQERTAMLLAFFLGSFGIDQFYAHHWPLAVFKLLTLGAGGIWWLVDVVLWMVGGVYGTPGCPGGSEHSWQY
ncbi:hypothetical protein BKA60DRAFT_474715, partial [Fusarium oxysporum]